MDLTSVTSFITEIKILLAVFVPFVLVIIYLINGMKCLLRKEILSIYYEHKDTKTFRQYEYENLVLLYKAYRALLGNSFVKKIHKEMESWKVES